MWHVTWRFLLYSKWLSYRPDSCNLVPQLLYFPFVNLIIQLQLPTVCLCLIRVSPVTGSILSFVMGVLGHFCPVEDLE